MPTLNLNNIQALYYGNTLVQNLYKGTEQLYPFPTNGSKYWRVVYNMYLSEIQASFNGDRTPIPLLTSNGYSIAVTGESGSSGSLNDNDFGYGNSQYIGASIGNTTAEITLPTPSQITSLWLHPQNTGAGSFIYNKPTFFDLYRSDDNKNTWTLVKHHDILSTEMATGVLYEFLI